MLNAYHNNPITTGFIMTEWFALNCPSATQLLRHHTISGSTVPTLNVNMTKLFNKLRNLNGCFGYPKDCKSYAVTLGALDGTGQLANDNTPMVSGAQAFDYVAQFVQAGDVRTYPAAPIPANGFVNISQHVGLFINSNSNKAPSVPVDVAPGGYSNVFGLVADGIAGQSFAPSVNKICDKACFIASISSIDYNTTDVFYNISSDISSNTHLANTPFEDFYSSNSNTNKEHIDNISSSTLTWIKNLVLNSNSNNTCGIFDININGGNYNYNYYDKAQNNITIDNVILNANIFDIFAGNEIQIKNEVSINANTEFRAYIKNCTAAKSCNYPGNTLRVMNGQNNDLAFTAESYENYCKTNSQNVILKQKDENLINRIYPNPSEGNLVIMFSSILSSDFNCSVEDITGKILIEQKVILDNKTLQQYLNLNSFVNGIYVLKITDNKGKVIKSEKIILNR
jgi:hypothetical protein